MFCPVRHSAYQSQLSMSLTGRRSKELGEQSALLGHWGLSLPDCKSPKGRYEGTALPEVQVRRNEKGRRPPLPDSTVLRVHGI